VCDSVCISFYIQWLYLNRLNTKFALKFLCDKTK